MKPRGGFYSLLALPSSYRLFRTIDLDAASNLSWMQRRRYWVERCFEDGESQCGMADYQVRLWNAWHHHMALVMMAMLFMLTESLHMKNQCPLLSCADIERLLAVFLPLERHQLHPSFPAGRWTSTSGWISDPAMS